MNVSHCDADPISIAPVQSCDGCTGPVAVRLDSRLLGREIMLDRRREAEMLLMLSPEHR